MTKIRPRETHAGELSGPDRRYLLTGFALEFREFGERERRQWESHRQELLEFFSQDPDEWEPDPLNFWAVEPAGPGHRPAAWWECEAPEPRRIIEQKPNPPNDDRRQPPLEERETHLGVPWPWFDWFKVESEPAYLRRHGLLTDREEEQLAGSTGAFDPKITPHWARDRWDER